ncbi:hypothetical protein TNCV_1849901 [Trichonephila clavipes]|nr:hypothetical protein TNCV_1849901 [Trichonephila clavipes]
MGILRVDVTAEGTKWIHQEGRLPTNHKRMRLRNRKQLPVNPSYCRCTIMFERCTLRHRCFSAFYGVIQERFPPIPPNPINSSLACKGGFPALLQYGAVDNFDLDFRRVGNEHISQRN